MRLTLLIALCTIVAADAHAARRALLIGINDYTSSRWAGPRAAGRDWKDLNGAVNDVEAMREVLVSLYGFEHRDIVALTDQRATREAILQSLEQHLVKPASKGDVLLFYYAGHGSQVRNSLSEEPDRMDESIVPADSRAGARDIRDKELRVRFNAILDSGARLTVILDNCHSGSGARGLATAALTRGIRPDRRDVADGTRVPQPEARGALILAAAQDFDEAWETRDEERKFHGAFSWALLRAMRDSSAGESASETFLRAQARLRGEMPFQEPVMAGNDDARRAPFLGTRNGSRTHRTAIFVERVQRDGTVLLQGGWAHGLSIGTELQHANTRLTVTALTGLARAQARIASGPAIKPGAMLEVVRKMQAWDQLESPPDERSPYRLALRSARNGVLAKGVLAGGETYDVVLQSTEPVPARVRQRYVYVFVIDNRGASFLLFPRRGSVENRIPFALPAPPEIRLGKESAFEVAPPYGVDTYFLLTTDEPLPDPWILQWDGVRTRGPLQRLRTWSLEKIAFESVPPRHKRNGVVSTE